MTDLSPIVRSVDALRKTQDRVILVLDGMAAAGKTTAAGLLAARWAAPVIHMDDFFLPPALRTEERLSAPGGNVHHERFRDEVLPFLRTDRPFSYQSFDCGRMDFCSTRTVPAAPVLLVEGAYAMHPLLGRYWDAAAFFSIDPETQRARILRRNGEEGWKAFAGRWIPMENAYHAAFGIPARADILIETETELP